MITIDTAKIKAPMSTISNINNVVNWTNTQQESGGVAISDKSRINNVDLGLKSIMLDHYKEEIQIELSAKILKENYKDLISINNISQVVETINKSNVIELDTNKFIDSGKFLKVDYCNNLEVEQNVNDYFKQMLGVRANTKYEVKRYNKKNNQGVVIQGNQQSFKERLIMYNKMLDIERDKEIVKHISFPTLQKQFANVLRVEQNTAQLRRIRHYANTKTTDILDILGSSAKPNLMLFQKATNKFMDLTLFNDYQGMKMYEVEKLEGRKTIIERLNYDEEMIKEFIRSKVKGNPSKYYKAYLTLLYSELNKKEMIIEPQENIFVKEIHQLLAAA